MRRIAGGVSIAMAVFLAAQLSSCGGKSSAPGEVSIEVTDAGFVPAVVTVPRGRPYTLVVTRKVEATCATELVFDQSGDRYALPLDQTVRIPMPAAGAETLAYACGMGMLRGRVVVK
jgi:plastocyanin domain-containing protein